MKKLLILLSIILFSKTSFSQSFNKVTKSIYLQYNGYDWIEKQSEYPNGLYVILKDYQVTINNRSESKYVTYGESEKTYKKDYTLLTWKAIDKDGKDCRFGMEMMKNYNTTIFFIYYEDYALEYICEQ